MSQRVLLITPPFTQPNTPYPATAYLKGFFNEQGIDSSQLDLSLDTILALFSADQLFKLFQQAETRQGLFAENEAFIYAHRQTYLNTIDPVINFLQNRNPTSAHLICSRTYLPEASRFNNLDDVDWAFGNMGIQDKAKHLATLYLEDLGDFIKSIIDPHFGFSRYAERLASSLSDFGPMDDALLGGGTFINDIYLGILRACILGRQPSLICLTVPFPGNLFAALKCGQFVKANFPEKKVVLGGGYCNTELRNIVDERLFKYIDFLCLDDGEAPLLCLMEYLSGDRAESDLKRTFRLHGGVVAYLDGAQEKDIPQRHVGTPDYRDLPVDRYLSMIEVPNPMHRLWSDGFWNKLTLAHGCYWGKCTFCDISLDYIARYEPINATLICDRIMEIIKQTGRTGFHFVDEAAPPALMRDLALELITRQVQITWWTNIRFEKRFTPDLCRLLHASGCIAISGGLEVASDRLLSLIQKGVTVEQVAIVTDAFTQAGIMVHAYLMYGFPTQTEQETIDALEMVRQMFELDIIQSGFWHRFAMTAHSPVGINPAAFKVEVDGPAFAGFAHNDLQHVDQTGADHRLYSEGLRKSLYNYMQGVGLDHPISEWFDFTVPDPTVAPNHIAQILAKERAPMHDRDDAVLIWLGGEVLCFILDEVDDHIIACEVAVHDGSVVVPINADIADWLPSFLASVAKANYLRTSFAELKADFERTTSLSFSEFLASDGWAVLCNRGLLIV